MRSQLGLVMLSTALCAVLACSSKSSSSNGAEAGGPCTDTIDDVFNDNTNEGGNSTVACPLNFNVTPPTPLPYDDAVTTTCAALGQTTGDIQYGQCFEYLVFEVDLDSSGNNLTKCFYDPSSHTLVGLIYGNGKEIQCGGTSFTVQAGTVDDTCSISGFNGGGAQFESCVPIVDAGSESMLLGQ